MKLSPQLSTTILTDPKLLNFLSPDADPWDATPLKGYVNKNNKVKGKYGESLVEIMMSTLGHTVGKAKSTTSGHDRVISNLLVEIKFGAAHRNIKNKGTTSTDVFSFNHFSVSKDWQRAIVIGVNIDCILYAVWFDKHDFIKEVSTDNSKYFSRQQAGKKGNNDDWMFMTNPTSWNSFINETWVKNINEW